MSANEISELLLAKRAFEFSYSRLFLEVSSPLVFRYLNRGIAVETTELHLQHSLLINMGASGASNYQMNRVPFSSIGKPVSHLKPILLSR